MKIFVFLILNIFFVTLYALYKFRRILRFNDVVSDIKTGLRVLYKKFNVNLYRITSNDDSCEDDNLNPIDEITIVTTKKIFDKRLIIEIILSDLLQEVKDPYKIDNISDIKLNVVYNRIPDCYTNNVVYSVINAIPVKVNEIGYKPARSVRPTMVNNLLSFRDRLHYLVPYGC